MCLAERGCGGEEMLTSISVSLREVKLEAALALLNSQASSRGRGGGMNSTSVSPSEVRLEAERTTNHARKLNKRY